MDYKQKYLKYRQKYFKLKNQYGGALCLICGGDHKTNDCTKADYIPDTGSPATFSYAAAAKAPASTPFSYAAAAKAPVAPIAPVAPVAPITRYAAAPSYATDPSYAAVPSYAADTVTPVATIGPIDDGNNGSGEWTTVTKIKKPKIVKPSVTDIPRDELLLILRRILSPYNHRIVAGYLYGSRARETNRIDSDADIIVFWKSTPNIDLLKELRDKIEAELGFEIDFVSCVLKRSEIKHIDDRDEAYYGVIALDVVQFIGTTISIHALFDRSIKMDKLNRR